MVDHSKRKVLLGALAGITRGGLRSPYQASLLMGLGASTKALAADLGPFEDVRKYGALVDGRTSDQGALQRALDTAPIGSTLYIPAGTLRVGKSAQPGASWCLLVSRLVHIWCDGIIRADLETGDQHTDLFKIAVSDAGGYGDVRNQTFRLRTTLNGGGRSSVRVEPALPVIRMMFLGGSLHGRSGPAMFCGGDMQGTVVVGNQINGGLEFGWANGAFHADNIIVRDNTIFGTRTGLVLDMIEGSFSHKIESNTIVSRDGAIHIRNGAQVKIRDNQFEQYQDYGQNAHPFQAMLCLEGTRYPVESCDITGNNFGGGTNVKNNIVLARSDKTVVDGNDFHHSAAYDIVMTAESMNSKIGRSNRVRGRLRAGSGFSALRLVDQGVANTGFAKPLSSVLNNNGWATVNAEITVVDGIAHLTGTFIHRGLKPASVIGQLPLGYRPASMLRIPIVNAGSSSMLNISSAGIVRILSAHGDEFEIGTVTFPVSGDVSAGQNSTIRP